MRQSSECALGRQKAQCAQGSSSGTSSAKKNQESRIILKTLLRLANLDLTKLLDVGWTMPVRDNI